jgi:sugar phosphate isomerase/epimerase
MIGEIERLARIPVFIAPSNHDAADAGSPYQRSRWPENASWDFVAVGRGHDVSWWRAFLEALEKVDADMAVNIEHEDQELGQMEGLQQAAATLREAAGR